MLLAAVLVLITSAYSQAPERSPSPTYPQSANKQKTPKGPRALGLLQIQSDGKARLFPIAILDNGKFFDAGIYKGKPVPMAVEPGTVYEGLKTGVSQGLFTATGAGQLNNNWMAEGTWLAAGATPARKGMKAEMPVIKDDTDAPPTLRRPGASPKPESKPTPKPDEKSEKPQAPPAPPQPAPSAEPKPVTPEPSAEEDPNRPKLRRGIPEPKAAAAPEKPAPIPASAKSTTSAKSAKPEAPLTFVAISDASGPDPRPYNFGAKPDEMEKNLKRMLDLAADDVRKRIDELAAATTSASATKTSAKKATGTAKLPQPKFSDIDFRVFDLSNANEPVWVLTAKAQMPVSKAADSSANAEYFITLACRTDIYGDLRKLLSQTTDARHLDVLSRLELIDAVDADGDGRGELLFREISDNDNRGYVLYRFTGDTLWKLFDSFGGE
jgi:hypothetical protein